jgi:ABC-type multidrug transport system fused ATPase/permease subunit
MPTFKLSFALVALALGLALAGRAWAQESAGAVQEKAQQTLESARETADALAKSIDASQQAQDVSAGILGPIYQLAEAFSFPAFHWVAFAVMVTGVVSFALQLTLGKLVVLAKFGFSPSEILSDALGLAVSLIGLVLTTQAAAENSSFTRSAAAVLSAAAVGAIAGFVFYLWGQRQELQAVEGRRRGPVAKVEGRDK